MNLLSENPRNQRPRRARSVDYYAYDVNRNSTANASIIRQRSAIPTQHNHAYAASQKPSNINLSSSPHPPTTPLYNPSIPHATSRRNPNPLPTKNLKIHPIHSYASSEITVTNWPSRDPIGEEGGVNLYGFCYNSPANYIDVKGETPVHVAVAAVVGLAYGSYKAGEGLTNFMLDIVDAFEEEEEAIEAFEEFAENPCEETLNNLEAKRKEAAAAKREAVVSGANVASTGLQGPPPTVPTSIADVVADSANIIIGETIGK